MFWIYERNLATKGQNDDMIKIWDLKSKDPLRSITLNTPTAYYLSISADGRLLAATTDDYTLSIINLEKGNLMCSITLDTKIQDLNYSEHGIFLSTGDGFLYGFEL